MRRLQLTTWSLLLLAAAATPALAQGRSGGGDPAQMIQRSTDRLLTGITLTPAQTDSVKSLNAHDASELTPLIEAMRSGGADAGGRQKMMEVRKRQRDELRAVLTPDQQTVFDKNVEEMEKARANRGGGRPGQ